jgi:hypothetical protein
MRVRRNLPASSGGPSRALKKRSSVAGSVAEIDTVIVAALGNGNDTGMCQRL